jgi:hypothetical protein
MYDLILKLCSAAAQLASLPINEHKQATILILCGLIDEMAAVTHSGLYNEADSHVPMKASRIRGRWVPPSNRLFQLLGS